MWKIWITCLLFLHRCCQVVFTINLILCPIYSGLQRIVVLSYCMKHSVCYYDYLMNVRICWRRLTFKNYVFLQSPLRWQGFWSSAFVLPPRSHWFLPIWWIQSPLWFCTCVSCFATSCSPWLQPLEFMIFFHFWTILPFELGLRLVWNLHICSCCSCLSRQQTAAASEAAEAAN